MNASKTTEVHKDGATHDIGQEIGKETGKVPVAAAPEDLRFEEDIQFEEIDDDEPAEAADPIEKETYADGFGELEADTNGQLRYVDLSQRRNKKTAESSQICRAWINR